MTCVSNNPGDCGREVTAAGFFRELGLLFTYSSVGFLVVDVRRVSLWVNFVLFL